MMAANIAMSALSMTSFLPPMTLRTSARAIECIVDLLGFSRHSQARQLPLPTMVIAR
jgi:hypothetical protein